MKRLSGYESMAHLYDLFDQKKKVEFFFHYASKTGDVLDIGAGTGRIALPLAKRGIKVCCVEPSLAMRRVFERKLDKHRDIVANIRLVAADSSSFILERTFPMGLLSGVFDHFLDNQERARSLVNIGHHIQVGGILVFDVFLGLMKDSPLSPAGRVEVENKVYQRFVGGKVVLDKKKLTIV